jgi:hypothetical protein
MAIESISGRSRSLGIAAVVLGLLGFGFYWWAPLGMVLSLTGLVMAIIGWVSGPGVGGMRRLIVAGLVISAAALAVDVFVAVRGLEIIQLMPYR